MPLFPAFKPATALSLLTPGRLSTGSARATGGLRADWRSKGPGETAPTLATGR
jgi:hypothetical protein